MTGGTEVARGRSENGIVALRRMLATGVGASALMVASLAAAQTAPDQTAQAQNQTAQGQPSQGQAPQQPVTEITVSGIRASLEKAAELKRNAEAFVDAISAEDIGKFPDKNAAESLSRIPGITISHDWGDGETVNIEGTDADLNRTLLNGQTVASGKWYYTDVALGGRSFNFTLLPSQVVGNLEVYKSPEARIDEGSIGGTIIVHTRNPLDMDPYTNSIAGDINYNDRSRDIGGDVSGLISWHNADDTLGIALSAVRDDETTRRDGLETFGWGDVGPVTLANGQVLNGGKDVYLPYGVNSTLLTQEKITTGGTVGVEYKPDSRWQFSFNAFYNRLHEDNTDQSFYLNPQEVFGTAPILAGKVVNNFLVQETMASPPPVVPTPGNYGLFGNNAVENDAFVRDVAIETFQVDQKVAYKGDGWRASVEGGYTRATGGTQAEYATGFGGNYGFSYDISQSGQTVSIPFNPRDPNKLYYLFGGIDSYTTIDDESFVQADYEHDLSLGPINSIMVGVKYRNHYNADAGTQANDNVDAVSQYFTKSVVSNGPTPSNLLEGMSIPGEITGFPAVDINKQKAFLNGRGLVLTDNPIGDFSVTEQVTAGYVQLNYGGDNYHGNFGVRYIQTDQSANFYNVAAGIVTPVSVSNPYSDIEPSLNFAVDLDDHTVLRMAAAEVMARDDYGDLAGAVNLSTPSLFGTKGNPDLKPYRSSNFDLSAEWYPEKDAVVAAAVFYKQIQSYVVTTSDTEYYSVANFQHGVPQPYVITYPINGGGGHNEGLELQVQHDIWGGFGAIASYTYSYAELDAGGSAPGNSRHSGTITGFYEDEKLSSRISYTYRTPWLLGYDGPLPQYHDAEGELDFNTSYKITPDYSVVFEAINLTDVTSELYDVTKAAPVGIYKSGRRFRLGFNASF